MGPFWFTLCAFLVFIAAFLEYWAAKRHRDPGIETGARWGLFTKDKGIIPFLRAEDVYTKTGLAYRRWARVVLGLTIVAALLSSVFPLACA